MFGAGVQQQQQRLTSFPWRRSSLGSLGLGGLWSTASAPPEPEPAAHAPPAAVQAFGVDTGTRQSLLGKHLEACLARQVHLSVSRRRAAATHALGAPAAAAAAERELQASSSQLGLPCRGAVAKCLSCRAPCAQPTRAPSFHRIQRPCKPVRCVAQANAESVVAAAAALAASGTGPQQDGGAAHALAPDATIWDWTRIGATPQAHGMGMGAPPAAAQAPGAAADQDLRARLAAAPQGPREGGPSPRQALHARAALPGYAPFALGASLQASAELRAAALAREAGANRARVAAAAMLRPYTGSAAPQVLCAGAAVRPAMPPSIAGPRWVSPAEDTVCVTGLAGRAASGLPVEILLRGMVGGAGAPPGAEMVPRSAVLQLLDALRLVRSPPCFHAL